MVFKASKKRERKPPEPVAEGTQMIPSAAIKNWYESRLNALIVASINDYRRSLAALFKKEPVKEFYAQDASVNSIFTKTLKSLNDKWKKTFKEFGKETSQEFTDKTNRYSKTSSFFSMSSAGVKEPVDAYKYNVDQLLGASQEFNNTLITGIQEEMHEKIFAQVMLSLTSPNPDEQGQDSIINALQKIEGMSKRRSELIARDQTAKLYSSLNTERMKANGVTKFKWIHSSAGKVPRHSHVEKDGMIFTHDDPRLWEGNKSDQGPPGWAINCRCRSSAVIDLD